MDGVFVELLELDESAGEEVADGVCPFAAAFYNQSGYKLEI